MSELTTNDLYPSRKSGRPQIIERKDPVIYADPEKPGALPSEQLAFYAQNGYLFLPQFFAEHEVEEMVSELRSVWSRSRESDAPEVIREPGGSEIRSVFAVHRDNGLFQSLSEDRRIVDIARHILGSDVYIHQSRINFKPGFDGKEFYWHSDFETWHVEDGMPRMRALSCSIALEDNYSFNGPLMVIPGSHRYFIACVGETPEQHYKESLRRQEYGVPDRESLTWLAQTNGIEAPTGNKGSILFFDCNVMHGSNSNITPFPRSNIFMVYNSVENRLERPFSGQQPRPEFIAAR